jgi:hypothetical protein
VSYAKALDKVTDAAKVAFGDNITRDFVEENVSLFKDFADGVDGSAEQIREKLAENLLSSYDETSKELDKIQEAVTGLEGLEFDIYGRADGSEIFAMFTEVLGGAEEAQKAIEALGYQVTWVPDGEPVNGL